MSPGEARQILSNRIAEYLRRDGFIEASSKGQPHNRIIAIGPAENRPWLALYDSISGPDEESDFILLSSYSDFTELVKCISFRFGPAVRIEMDDIGINTSA